MVGNFPIAWDISNQPQYCDREFPDSKHIMVGNSQTTKILWWGISLQHGKFTTNYNIVIGNSQTVEISWWEIPL
jgi:hypothetical protein